MKGMGEVSSILGAPAQAMPEDFKSNIAFAEEMLKKIRGGNA